MRPDTFVKNCTSCLEDYISTCVDHKAFRAVCPLCSQYIPLSSESGAPEIDILFLHPVPCLTLLNS